MPLDIDVLRNPQAYLPTQIFYAAWQLLNTDPIRQGVSPWELRELVRVARYIQMVQ